MHWSRKRRQKKKKKLFSQDVALQITSLADVLVILLVFLIKTFSTADSSISIASSLTLPHAEKAEEMVNSLKVEVAKDQLFFNDEVICILENHKFMGESLEASGFVRMLRVALENWKKTNPNAIEVLKQPITPQTFKNFKMLIFADEQVPYVTVKRILATAASVGFLDYKLVVMEDQ